MRDQYLIYADKVLDAFSEGTCRQACNQEREFNCRSYSFLSEVSKQSLIPYGCFHALVVVNKGTAALKIETDTVLDITPHSYMDGSWNGVFIA